MPGSCGDPDCPGHEHAHGNVHDSMAYEAGEDVGPWVMHHHCTPSTGPAPQQDQP